MNQDQSSFPADSSTRAAVSPKAIKASPWDVLWLVGIFLMGFLLIFGFHRYYHDLLDELKEKRSNERARVTIGEEIVQSLRSIEKDVYRMALTPGAALQERIETEILGQTDRVEHCLNVLQNGGTVEQVLYLNIGGQDKMVRKISYSPGHEQTGYVMEVIELAPHMDQLRGQLKQLKQLFQDRAQAQTEQDEERINLLQKEIGAFFKRIPSFFIRVNENTNRLFYMSQGRLAELESQFEIDQRRYELLEVNSVLLVTGLASLAGILLARKINISKRKLEQTWEEMRRSKEQAEEASRAKSSFVSRMSHELRTPLNAILGLAQLLDRTQLMPDQTDFVDKINRAGQHLLELINHVLDHAKIEAGQLNLSRMDYDLVATVDDVAAIIAETAHKKGIEVKAFASADIPSVISGDPSRVRQILLNLLGNAVKFTESGEVGVRVERDHEGTRILFSVWDTGIGIEEEALPRLFQPFSQADESTTRKYGGTGLGLLICKELVEAMGGSIEVQSAPGKGSRFTFHIPLVPSEHALPRTIPLKGAHALVACSNSWLAEILSRHLASMGAQVAAVSDHEKGMTLKGKGMVDFDLVVADAGNGWAFSRGFGREKGVRTMRFLVAESESGEVEKRDAGLPHVDALLRRPLTFSRLAEAVTLAQAEHTGGRVSDSAGARKECDQYHGHVLLVEDNTVNQLVAVSMLNILGLTVSVAGNGLEALERIEAERFDLVLMDVEMPLMDGYAATKSLREKELKAGRGAHLPVIAITANALEDDRSRCMECGMDDHLSKPFFLNDLSKVISLYLHPV